MQVNLVIEGLSFMILGMSSVFAFLILLVFILKLQGVFLNKFFQEKVAFTYNKILDNENLKDNEELVAVITTAVNRFRKEKF